MIPSPQNNGAVEVAAPTAPHFSSQLLSTYQADVSDVNRAAVDLPNFPTIPLAKFASVAGRRIDASFFCTQILANRTCKRIGHPKPVGVIM